MSTPKWQDDLFGGRDKVYIDKKGNEVRLSQDAANRKKNEELSKGDYPHHTYNHNGDEKWHHSEDNKTHK